MPESLAPDRTFRILIVDDEPANVDILRRMIEAHFNCALVVARDGKRALKLATAEPPDLILSDIHMPEMDGLELCRTLREHPRTRDVPVIMITADRDAMMSAFRAGAVDYIPKPVTQEELVARVATHLSLSQLVKDLEAVVKKRTARLQASHEALRREAQERIVLQERLDFLARHDALTRLLNRQEFIRQLEPKLAADQGGYIIYFDVDGLSALNHSHGHAAGDACLAYLAGRIRRHMGDNDLAARVGDDDFAWYCVERHPEEPANTVAAQLRGGFSWPGLEHAVTVTCAAIPLAGISRPEEALSLSLTLCRAIKGSGTEHCRIYKQADVKPKERRAEIELTVTLRNALAKNNLVLYRQRIVSLTQPEQMPRYELLLRIIDGERVRTAGEVIGVARAAGLLGELDRQVVSAAASWMQTGDRISHYSINISAASLEDAHFLRHLIGELHVQSVDPQRLSVEISERAAIPRIEKIAAFAVQLQALGIGLTLDDYGTGYATQLYLKELPVDTIKIDGTFITNIHREPISRRVVSSVVELARGLGKQTVGEQVSSEEAADCLTLLGVDFAQGYYFHRPEPLPWDEQGS